MNPDLQTVAALLLRHALGTGAGALAAHGYISSSATEQVVAVGMMLAGAAWSWWQKRGQALLLAEVQELRSQRVKQAMQHYQSVQMQQAQAAQAAGTEAVQK